MCDTAKTQHSADLLARCRGPTKVNLLSLQSENINHNNSLSHNNIPAPSASVTAKKLIYLNYSSYDFLITLLLVNGLQIIQLGGDILQFFYFDYTIV